MHLGGKQRWTDSDRLLILAWQMYQDSLCNDCGQDRERAYNPDMDGWYEVKPIECHACAALEQHRDGQKKPNRAVKEYLIDGGPPADKLLPWIPDLSPSEPWVVTDD